MNTVNEIPIFFSIDDGYAPFLSVALNSAIKNSDKCRNYKAIILYEELSEEHKSKLSSLATPNFKIKFIPMLKGLESITDRKSNHIRCEYFTLTIYFRLFIAAMFPQYDKGIYIDSDIVLLDDIAKLYDIDIGDNFIGACYDHSIEDIEPFCKYIREAVGVDDKKYINSGVLLMNLKKLREENFHEHFLALLNEYHFDSVAPDQDYINAICHGKIHYLSDIWDTMPNASRPINSDAKLVHYNLFSKPWCYDDIQYGEYFWEYAADSGYIEHLKEFRRSFTPEKTEEEKKCLQNMINTALSIIDNDITFKKVYEKGVKVRL